MVAMNELKKKCVGLQRTRVSKRTVFFEQRLIQASRTIHPDDSEAVDRFALFRSLFLRLRNKLAWPT